MEEGRPRRWWREEYQEEAIKGGLNHGLLETLREVLQNVLVQVEEDGHLLILNLEFKKEEKGESKKKKKKANGENLKGGDRTWCTTKASRNSS